MTYQRTAKILFRLCGCAGDINLRFSFFFKTPINATLTTGVMYYYQQLTNVVLF